MAMRVDGDRLWARLMAMAEVGPGVSGGSNRQALSDDDAAGRALLLSWASAAGCSWEFDAIGNLFITRAGAVANAPSVLVGSHLDTQPTGGRFDGVYGVLGGFEVIESLNDDGIVTEAPIEVVVWTNEEGSRFQHSMMGSAVWAGSLGLSEARALTDIDGVSVGEELDRLGWNGRRSASPADHAAAFELHIEQGPILEATGTEIGIVTDVQGLRWYTIELFGYPAHAGPTPMDTRRDPARALGEIINAVYELASAHAPQARATFAMFESEPTSPNTVPETIRVRLDVRHPDAVTLDTLDEEVHRIVESAATGHDVGHAVRIDNHSPPVQFAEQCVSVVERGARVLGMSSERMVSGAGHDACYVAAHVPTSMIFVPCDDGLSHNEAENISQEQAEGGASVLLHAVLEAARMV